jgi:DNA-directed RNA polymerase specialized sigma24 family protein
MTERLEPRDFAEIVLLYSKGVNPEEISQLFDVEASTVQDKLEDADAMMQAEIQIEKDLQQLAV